MLTWGNMDLEPHYRMAVYLMVFMIDGIVRVKMEKKNGGGD